MSYAWLSSKPPYALGAMVTIGSKGKDISHTFLGLDAAATQGWEGEAVSDQPGIPDILSLMDEYDLSYLYKIEIILYTFICSVNINIPPGQFIFFEIAADILKYGHISTY